MRIQSQFLNLRLGGMPATDCQTDKIQEMAAGNSLDHPSSLMKIPKLDATVSKVVAVVVNFSEHYAKIRVFHILAVKFGLPERIETSMRLSQ